MGRMNLRDFAWRIVILVIVVIGVVSYLLFTKKPSKYPSSSNINQVQTTPSNSKNQPDNCSFIMNSSFRSVNKYEVGLGPNGPAIGYWGIAFKDNSFEWGHSDVTEIGSYSCENNVLQVKFFNRSTTANYDASRKILIWEGVEYKKVE